MEKINKKFDLWSYILILVGTCALAFSVQDIYAGMGLVTGGFTGLAIVVQAASDMVVAGGIPTWFTNVVLNVPVFILAYVFIGKKFVGKTLFGTVMLSVWLYILPVVDIAQGDYMIAAIFGGLFSGGGMGLVLRGNATTGGTDMVSALIQRKLRHYSVVQIMQVLDGTIVLVGFWKFGLRATLYAIVAIFITTKVSDAILEGFNYSKAAYIITDHHEEIAKHIMVDLDRGVTGLFAKGMYTNDEKCVLYCVVSKKEIVAVKELVAQVDPNAFVIVSDVREVLGEGFLEYNQTV